MKDELKLVLTTKVDAKIDAKTPNFNTERSNLNDYNFVILILFQVYKDRCSTVQITLHLLMCVKIKPLFSSILLTSQVLFLGQ